MRTCLPRSCIAFMSGGLGFFIFVSSSFHLTVCALKRKFDTKRPTETSFHSYCVFDTTTAVDHIVPLVLVLNAWMGVGVPNVHSVRTVDSPSVNVLREQNELMNEADPPTLLTAPRDSSSRQGKKRPLGEENGLVGVRLKRQKGSDDGLMKTPLKCHYHARLEYATINKPAATARFLPNVA